MRATRIGALVAFVLMLILLVPMAFAGDIIINDEGQFEGNEYQKAVFVSVFLPEDMVCSQPVTFVMPTNPEPEPEECSGLVISPGGCVE